MKNISVVVTSYNRWGFLKSCIDSFIKLTDGESNIIIIEDSTKSVMRDNIVKQWGNSVNLIFNEKNIGQSASMDKALKQVKTPYVLKAEDDYIFNKNPNFMKEAIDILDHDKDVNQIWLRHINNYKVSHGPDAPTKMFDKETLATPSGSKYNMVKVRGPWNGFSYQTSIFRMDDYRNMFPEGYAKASEGKPPGVHQELACARHTAQFNYRAALLTNGCCETTHKNSTYK